jgi:Beta-ketoacyl synthase, N-terminal domain
MIKNIPSRLGGLTVYLDAVGVFAPSMVNWADAQKTLLTADYTPLLDLPIPAPLALPPAERRRVGTAVKLALAAGLDALHSSSEHKADLDGSKFQTVFTSSGGDGDNCHNLCEALAEPVRAVSPTRFTNSVHNAPSGYWGIALKAKPASTSICAFDGSFVAGMLDAVTQSKVHGMPVLLVSYDTPYPEPLRQVRPVQSNVAVALLLSPVRSVESIAALTVELTSEKSTVIGNPFLEQLRINNPTARALPLLLSLAKRVEEIKVLDYLHDLNLRIHVQPLSSNTRASGVYGAA